MSIKFPDFQVLVSRSDQIPRINREGDQTGAAGKMAPQITQEFARRQEQVVESEAQEKVRERQEERERNKQKSRKRKQSQNKKPPSGSSRHIDLRA